MHISNNLDRMANTKKRVTVHKKGNPFMLLYIMCSKYPVKYIAWHRRKAQEQFLIKIWPQMNQYPTECRVEQKGVSIWVHKNSGSRRMPWIHIPYITKTSFKQFIFSCCAQDLKGIPWSTGFSFSLVQKKKWRRQYVVAREFCPLNTNL
jgi:hypothetical protein